MRESVNSFITQMDPVPRAWIRDSQVIWTLFQSFIRLNVKDDNKDHNYFN